MPKRLIVAIFRQVMQRPVLSFLNILGLAGGVATCILIFLYAWSELNYDSWVPNQKDLYRVEGHFVRDATGFTTSTMAPLRDELRLEGSLFSEAVRRVQNNWPVKRGDFVNYEPVNLVDPGFLDMFPLDFVVGSKEAAFATPNSIILNQSMAQKYFGDTDAVGHTLTVNGDINYTVSGVFKDVPDRSDANVRILVPLQVSQLRYPESWSNISMYTFARLKVGIDVTDANAQLARIVEKYRPFIGSQPGEMSEFYRLFLQPFGDIHLGSSNRTGADSMGDYGMIYGFVAIAVLILAISAFNYVSLSTARALEREKEVCLRKVMGAERKQIIKEVMVESVTLTAITSLLGMLIVVDVLPLFSKALGQEFLLSDLFQPTAIAAFIFGTLLLGVLSGLYPALFISGFRPIKFLSGGRSQRAGLNKFRRGLVFVQFTVCISLIIGAVAVSKQINHINNIELGFDQSNLLVVRGVDRKETISRVDALKQTISAIPGVEAVTRSRIVPLDSSTAIEGFYNHDIPRDEDIGLRLITVDYDFFDVYGATLIAGRRLSEQYANDSVRLNSREEWTEERGVGGVIIGERAVDRLGYETPEAAIGEQIMMTLKEGGGQPLNIVGVVRNIRFNTTRSNPQGALYHFSPERMRTMTLRVSEGATENVVSELGSIWQGMFPDTPLRLDFMEERIASQYSNEDQQLRLFVFFAGLTLLISLIGLIGLVMNSVTHRTKEISIRRVVGASVSDVIKLLTWDYLKPVIIANVPAWFLAWYFLGEWLEQYAQRFDMGISLYLLGGGVILAVTMIVVMVLVTRSALTPPVYALRYE